MITSIYSIFKIIAITSFPLTEQQLSNKWPVSLTGAIFIHYYAVKTKGYVMASLKSIHVNKTKKNK